VPTEFTQAVPVAPLSAFAQFAAMASGLALAYSGSALNDAASLTSASPGEATCRAAKRVFAMPGAICRATLAATFPAIAVTGDGRRRKRRKKSPYTFLLGPSAGKAGKKVPYEEAG
jgi:hypothetical protein